MGSFMSSAYATPEESGSESNVIAVHSKDRFDEQFQAHKNSNKAVICLLLRDFLLLLYSVWS